MEKTPQSARRGKKLLYFLSRMSREEQAELSHWLRSPLHSNSEQFAAMLEVMLRVMREQALPELSPELFSSILSPQREMDDKKANYIRVRITQFQDALLDYIAWTRYRKDLPAQRRYLLASVCERGWERNIAEAYEAGIKALPQRVEAKRILDELELEMAYSSYLAGQGRQDQDKHLPQVNGALDQYFVLQKLKYACAGLPDGDPASNPDKTPLLAAAIAHAQTNLADLPQVTQAYLRAYQMLQSALQEDGSAAHHRWQQYRAAIAQPVAFGHEEASDLFAIGQNFCILQYRKGQMGFVSELQNLYDLVLDSGAILQDGLMAPLFYKNAVELMCRLQRLDWVAGFIEAYRDRIAHDPERLVYDYNRGVLRFYKAEYQGVIDVLYNIVAGLERMQLGESARVYLCQAFWEIGEVEWLMAALKAFDQHLRRHDDMAPEVVRRYKTYVAYLSKACVAITAAPNLRRNKLSKVLAEIEAHEPANLHKWLRSKLSEAIEGRGAAYHRAQ
jgi:hypothetical protein